VFNDCFIKIIEAPFLLEKQDVRVVGFNKGNYGYHELIGEEACGEANWSNNSIFFYHLYKVMAVWKNVWAAKFDGDDEMHRNVFVPVEVLFGEFSVCLRSPLVGTNDAADETFSNNDLMTPVVDAVLWLARTWLLLYIDIRPPNLRISAEGDAAKVHLVDYDDLVLLKEQPCCDYSTVCTMRKNEHVKKVFRKYKNLAELFDSAGEASVCVVCELERNKV
jgi:hypothetical protein